MKSKLILLTVFVFITSVSFSQNTKHSITSGKVIFDISYPDSQFDDQTMSNFPTESIMYFKNDKSRVEVSMAMGKTIVISDNKSGNAVMLMDMMGNKMAIDMNKADIEKEKQKTGKPKVEKTRESKTIAGYTCYKAIITMNDKSFDAWFTNDLSMKNSFSSEIEGVDGFLMEFYNQQNGMNMKMTCRSVEPTDVSDSQFDIPEGYKKMTMDDLKKMGGGSH